METLKNHVQFTNDRLKNLVDNLSKCKLEYSNCKEECKRLGEINIKLEVELKEAVELEKSHRYHLLTSREMIGNLQDTVTQLLYLKRDVKRLKDEVNSKDSIIASMEADKEACLKQFNRDIDEIRNQQANQIQELTSLQERKVQQIQYESETQIAQCNCLIEELREKLKEMEIEDKEKVNIVVLEYEEKIQRSAAQVALLQDQLERQTARTETNMDAYRRKLEDLEEKLKQSQFKEYLAQSSYPFQYENRVERPYSETGDYTEMNNEKSTPVFESPTTQNRSQTYTNSVRKPKPLQVVYKDNKSLNIPKTNERKGPFNITKKRKLYTDKDFVN